MAQFVGTRIDIDGTNISQFSSLTIAQSIFEHHNFRLICPTEAIDGTQGILNSSRNMIGGTIKIQIQVVGGNGTLQFAGVVTQVEASRRSGHAGDIIISGFSPTILLDNGPHCQSWEKKAVKNIAQDVLGQFPQNLLQPNVNPSYGETLSYTVQYKETAWQFLSRIAATYGEWFFYDGVKLVLGPPQGPQIKMTYGQDLRSFNMALQVRPANFQAMAYDYMNYQVYDGQPNGIADKAGLNDLGKHALQKSQQFYSTTPKQWHNSFLTNKKQLDDYVNARAAMQSSNMVRFNGNSGDPGVQIGGGISVQGKNVFSQSDESYGDYTVIVAQHHCDGQGHYSNDFVAIPSTVKMPPVPIFPEPHSETQSAIVTDNNDPKGLGRVRAKFHWMSDNEKTPWLRVTTPHAGSGKGLFLIPETGEEVIVGFEGNSGTKPYIIGSVYHGQAKNSFANAGNDVKTLQSRSGTKVVLNDNEGSVNVEDKDGNNMKMDGAGNINVTSKESIVLTCGNAKLEMKKDGTINVNGKTITHTASENATMVSGGASFSADGKKNEANMGSNKTTVSGNTEANVNGAKTTVSATGKVAVQGAIVALN
ncbi:MAG TPA: phage baseplate assembly protein V [Puia sp.]|nr:phage baseplate assembly protein V [Puia sp.]